MRIRRPLFIVLLAGGTACMMPSACEAQCCLSELFAGCRKAPAAYAVAPIPAPVPAPIFAPVAAGRRAGAAGELRARDHLPDAVPVRARHQLQAVERN